MSISSSRHIHTTFQSAYHVSTLRNNLLNNQKREDNLQKLRLNEEK